jgi:hypothetical protein
MTQPGQPDSREDKASHTGKKRLIFWAAGLSIGVVIAHAIDAPDHIREWWGYSTFFITVGAFQFFYGFGLLLQPWRYDETGSERSDSERRGRPYYVLGLALAASTIVFYIVTRTTGMPFLGSDATAERITGLSLIPIVVNVVLIYCLVRLIMRTATAATHVNT